MCLNLFNFKGIFCSSETRNSFKFTLIKKIKLNMIEKGNDFIFLEPSHCQSCVPNINMCKYSYYTLTSLLINLI